jgi:hypothetical protein
LEEMMVRCLTAVLFLALSAQAQEKVYLSGFVNDISTLQPLSYVNISSKGVVVSSTEQNGFFTLAARKNDTIVFTRLGYQPYTHVAVEDSWDERIFMTEMSKVLDEVTIYGNHQIHGNDEIQRNLRETAPSSLNNFTMDPNNQNRMVQTFGPSVTFGAPWNKWTKDAREKKRLHAVLTEKERTMVYNDFIQSMAVEEYFMDTFQLDRDTYLKFKEGFIVSHPDARYLTSRKDIVDLMVAYFASRKP